MDTTKPSAAALARAIEGHVILWLAKIDPDHFSGFAPIARDLDISPEIVRATLREHFLRFLPEGFEIIEPVAGALFFQAEGE